jgi:hypothetical protein
VLGGKIRRASLALDVGAEQRFCQIAAFNLSDRRGRDTIMGLYYILLGALNF